MKSQKPLLRQSVRTVIMRWASVFSLATLLIAFNVRIQPALAAQLTSLKDVQSTMVDSANSNHTISFVAPSAVANNTTIAVTFATGFDLTGVLYTDIDLAGTTESELVIGANCSATEDASAVIAGQVLTFDLCTGDGGDFTNAETITIEIGTHSNAPGVNQINNQTSAQNNSDPTIDVVTALDSGSLAVEVIADDSVNVTATVEPSITFSISDTTIEFGTLSASAVKYADDSGGNGTNVAAHTMSVGTNATGGFAITYAGALLTSGGNTIDAATITGDIDGSFGTEQFAMAYDDNAATLTIVSAYDEASSNLKFDTTGAPNQNIQIISTSGPVASTNIDAHYLANIAANTQAGNYFTNITYIATGTF